MKRLQDSFSNTGDQRKRNELNLIMQEVYAEAKPYMLCDKYELTELKNQLLDNMRILAGLGKSTEAFDINLKDVQFRLDTLMMEEALREKNRLQPDVDQISGQHDHAESVKELQKRERQKKSAKGQARWVVGMDPEDEDS